MVLDRRGFMIFGAGFTAGILATPVVWKSLDDVSIWSQNWPWIPANEKGASTFVSVVSKTCPSCVGMKVRLVDGRPVRVVPDMKHPLGGGVTALAAAEVQMLHSPARLVRPLKRSSDGAYAEISWEEAEKLVAEKLKAAGEKTVFVSGDETSSINEVISAVAAGLKSENVFLMPSEGQSASMACDLMGIPGQIGYDLENSDYVLAIGANVLESWGTVVRNRRVFAAATPHPAKDAKAKVTFAYAGPVQNQTAAVAKPWLPILPGTEGILALGIAHLLIAKGKSVPATDFNAFRELAAKYTPDVVAKATGLPAAKLTELVDALLKAKAPVVIMGSTFNQGLGAAPHIAGIAVNALLGTVNQKGGLTLLPEAAKGLAAAKTRGELYKKDFASYLAGSQKPAALVLYESNPLYALPNPAGVKDALNGIPFKVAFSTFMDETASMCDLVLPIAMGIERLDDTLTPYGCGKNLYCASKAAVKAPGGIKNGGDLLIGYAQKMGVKVEVKSYEEALKKKAKAVGANFDNLTKGQPFVSDAKINAAIFSFRPEILAKALVAPKGALQLTIYSKLSLGTAKTGIPPFNTKTIRAQELTGAEMSVMMNKATATKNKVADGDRVRLALAGGSRFINARLRVFEGVTNDTVAVCLGYGHTALDDFSKKKGANVMQLLTAAAEPETGVSSWNGSSVEIAKA